jgi:hypothetical protein
MEEIKNSLCHAQVTPFLYAIPENAPTSWEIMRELRKSMAVMAVLGPEVSRRYWTQVWIGFEIGVFAAFQVDRELIHPLSHRIPHTFLIEDVRQSSDAPVPFMDLALLLDFSDSTSWGAVQSITELINDNIPLERVDLARANNLRLFHLIDNPDFQCADPECKAKYELLIWEGNCQRDNFGFPVLPDNFSIKCVVCRKPMKITLSRTNPESNPVWTITSSSGVPHISTFLGI